MIPNAAGLRQSGEKVLIKNSNSKDLHSAIDKFPDSNPTLIGDAASKRVKEAVDNIVENKVVSTGLKVLKAADANLLDSTGSDALKEIKNDAQAIVSGITDIASGNHLAGAKRIVNTVARSKAPKKILRFGDKLSETFLSLKDAIFKGGSWLEKMQIQLELVAAKWAHTNGDQSQSRLEMYNRYLSRLPNYAISRGNNNQVFRTIRRHQGLSSLPYGLPVGGVEEPVLPPLAHYRRLFVDDVHLEETAQMLVYRSALTDDVKIGQLSRGAQIIESNAKLGLLLALEDFVLRTGMPEAEAFKCLAHIAAMVTPPSSGAGLSNSYIISETAVDVVPKSPHFSGSVIEPGATPIECTICTLSTLVSVLNGDVLPHPGFEYELWGTSVSVIPVTATAEGSIMVGKVLSKLPWPFAQFDIDATVLNQDGTSTGVQTHNISVLSHLRVPGSTKFIFVSAGEIGINTEVSITSANFVLNLDTNTNDLVLGVPADLRPLVVDTIVNATPATLMAMYQKVMATFPEEAIRGAMYLLSKSCRYYVPSRIYHGVDTWGAPSAFGNIPMSDYNSYSQRSYYTGGDHSDDVSEWLRLATDAAGSPMDALERAETASIRYSRWWFELLIHLGLAKRTPRSIRNVAGDLGFVHSIHEVSETMAALYDLTLQFNNVPLNHMLGTAYAASRLNQLTYESALSISREVFLETLKSIYGGGISCHYYSPPDNQLIDQYYGGLTGAPEHMGATRVDMNEVKGIIGMSILPSERLYSWPTGTPKADVNGDTFTLHTFEDYKSLMQSAYIGSLAINDGELAQMRYARDDSWLVTVGNVYIPVNTPYMLRYNFNMWNQFNTAGISFTQGNTTTLFMAHKFLESIYSIQSRVVVRKDITQATYNNSSNALETYVDSNTLAGLPVQPIRDVVSNYYVVLRATPHAYRALGKGASSP